MHTAVKVTPIRTDRLAVLLKLLQLTSPALPVGAYSYSQGLEWAVEQGLVADEHSARLWIADALDQVLVRLEAPILSRMYDGWSADDIGRVVEWNEFLLASRETQEFRLEDIHLGAALSKVIKCLGLDWPEPDRVRPSFAMAFSLAAARWQISKPDMISGYLWAWLENQMLAALKLVPLGQLAGQRILLEIAGHIPRGVGRGLGMRDDQIGGSMPMLAIASSRHESQYSRLFRS